MHDADCDPNPLSEEVFVGFKSELYALVMRPKHESSDA